MKPTDNAIEDRNIGTKENPKIVKLSKNLPAKEKEEYVNLMKSIRMYFLGVMKTLRNMILQ